MLKKIMLISIILLTLTACHNSSNKIDLEKQYYNEGKFILITSDEYQEKQNESFILYTYNNFCTFTIPCEDIFKEFMKKYQIDFLSMHYDEFRKTNLYETVKYAPSIIIVEKGNIVAYLDAEKDDDLNKYQDAEVFEKWLKEYINTK